MTEYKEKNLVAISSVFAAVFLTGGKLMVGLLTGSLGILSEAIHSGLDLVAAILTLIAVNLAGKPADKDHNFGHGKIENFSALVETLLLLFTCAWIIYEATKRLSSGLTEIEVNIWSFLVIIVSIIIDFSRSRALMKVAKKYDSRALEADALHFSSDILSSAVVIVGLIGAYFHIHIADSLAALIVAIIVIYIAFKLGKKSIDDLLDKSPGIYSDQIMNIAIEIPEILKVHDLKIRTSGSQVLIELNIHVAANLSIEDAHEISHRYENKIRRQIKKSVVHVHAEPEIVHYK